MKKSRFTPTPFGKRVAEERAKRNMLQDELAERAGVVPATLSRIETGETTTPKPDNAYAIGGALGMSAEEIASLLSDWAGEEREGELTTQMRGVLQEIRRLALDLSADKQDRLARLLSGTLEVSRDFLR